MSQLKTYRSDTSTPDVTTWNYDAASGLLSSKTYADGNSVSYAYAADGKLSTRTWSRGVVTSYAYNAAGDLTGITYSDSTPAVTISYNRLGQKSSVTDAVGSRSFAYNSSFDLTSEAISGLYSKTLGYSYDTLGRQSALSLDGNQMAGYAYDANGRLSGMSVGTNSLSYSRVANSDLLSGITRSNGVNTAYSYEANRNLITQVAQGSGLATYGYTNDAIGRRTAMSRAGSVFGSSDALNYGYNSRSEVTSAASSADTNYNIRLLFR